MELKKWDLSFPAKFPIKWVSWDSFRWFNSWEPCNQNSFHTSNFWENSWKEKKVRAYHGKKRAILAFLCHGKCSSTMENGSCLSVFVHVKTVMVSVASSSSWCGLPTDTKHNRRGTSHWNLILLRIGHTKNLRQLSVVCWP